MSRSLVNLLESYDELRARGRREELGQYRWLVSWREVRQGCWLARVSCPESADTVEAQGRTRCQAIAAAETELSRILSTLAHRS